MRFFIASIATSLVLSSSPALGASTVELQRAVREQINALTRELQQTIQELKEQNSALREQNAHLRKEREDVVSTLLEAKSAAATPPTATVPTYSGPVSASSNLINDFSCRPKLSYNTTGSAKGPDATRGYCRALNPSTRLILENLNAGVTGGYTNIAGSQNVGNLPITETATSFYQVGIGYDRKPILRQLRSLLINDSPEKPYAVTHQNHVLEDFLFNAVQLSAGVGYGRALTIKNDDRIETANDRPQYAATISYTLDLERAYVHLMYGGVFRDSWVRPIDPGYYYAPPSTGFWEGIAGNGSISYGPTTPLPTPTVTPTVQ